MSPIPRPWEAARGGAEGRGKPTHPPAGQSPPERQRQTRAGRGETRTLTANRRRHWAMSPSTATPDRRTDR